MNMYILLVPVVLITLMSMLIYFTIDKFKQHLKGNLKFYVIVFAVLVFIASQLIFELYAMYTNYQVIGSLLLSFWMFAIILPLVFLPVNDLSAIPQKFGTDIEKLISDRTKELDYRIKSFTNEINGAKYNSSTDDSVVLKDNKFKYLIACVDKFVDEAQQVLTWRAKSFYVVGTMAIIASVGTLTYAGTLAYESIVASDAILKVDSLAYRYPTHFVIVKIFSSLAVATAIYAIVKTLLSYGISFFHEGTRLLDRRHALRFGRLYMYLKREEYNFEELEKAFQWHMEAQTIFQSLSASKLTEGVFNQLVKSVSDTAEAIGKVKNLGSPMGEVGKGPSKPSN